MAAMSTPDDVSSSASAGHGVAASAPVRGGRLLRLGTDHHVRFTTRVPARIHCDEGLVWITCSGQLHDWVLRENEGMELGDGDWLVGALRPSVVRLESAQPGPVREQSRWRGLLDQFMSRLVRLPPALAPSV